MSLDYYAGIGAALFPIPFGQKSPLGIVASHAKDCTSDSSLWRHWLANNPGCNWGVEAGPSGLIIIDIDVVKAGPEVAWSAWCGLCAEWGLTPESVMPHVQTARGGWHVYFAVPPEIDARQLRQPDAVKGVINTRAGNGFTVAAGSYYDGAAAGEQSGHYHLLRWDPPYPAPAGLLEMCARKTGRALSSVVKVGSWDPADVADLLAWLGEADRDAFSAYEDWLSIGMALKVEFGDLGRDLWALTFDGTVTAEAETTKWESFSCDPRPGDVTLQSWFARAHKMGWTGQVRRKSESMFGDVVAALAANSGANLALAGANLALAGAGLRPSGGDTNIAPGRSQELQNTRVLGQQTLPNTRDSAGQGLGGPIVEPADSIYGKGVTMTGGTGELYRRGIDRCREFLAATSSEPSRPAAGEVPSLPDTRAGEPYYAPLQDSIARILAMAERHTVGLATRAIGVLGFLAQIDRETASAVVRRCNALGVAITEARVWHAQTALQREVKRHFGADVAQDFHVDFKGQIEKDNSDNVAIFLNMINAEIRWNAWLERVEILGWEYPNWTQIDDNVIARLRSRANRTEMRFVPSKDFLWDSLIDIAWSNRVDPALEALAIAESGWDGIPRLEAWISAVCGVPADRYHRAVARNIIGGMVRRVRQPGCKHDTMAVFCGPQGTGKSSLSAALAMDINWFTDATHLDEESKELVLLLSGVCVAEISEMTSKKGDIDKVKAQISKQTDKGRPAYGRVVISRPRRNIFVGSTNSVTPLTDEQNRRFLPVMVKQEMNLAWLRAALWQLIGEAAHHESRGDTFAIPREVWADAQAHQEAARAESTLEIQMADWFAPTELTGRWQYITAADLVDMVRLSGWRGNNAALSQNMEKLEFRQERIRIDGKQLRVWVRGPECLPTWILKEGVRYLPNKDNIGRVFAVPRLGAQQPGTNVLPFNKPDTK